MKSTSIRTNVPTKTPTFLSTKNMLIFISKNKCLGLMKGSFLIFLSSGVSDYCWAIILFCSGIVPLCRPNDKYSKIFCKQAGVQEEEQLPATKCPQT